MKKYNNFENNKIVKLLECLNSILQKICEVENLLETEIMNNELELYYEGQLKYKNFGFNNMSFEQINSFINYQKRICTYEERIKLDNLNDNIKEWFYNTLLTTSSMFKSPISYSLTYKLDELIFAIEDFNNEWYLLGDIIVILTKEQLNKLKIRIINDTHKFKIEINDMKKKYESLKADSDYIKKK